MTFNSFWFILFFLVVVILYYAIPQKFKNLVLLAASSFFYLTSSIESGCIIVGVIAIAYVFGRVLEKRPGKHLLAIGIIAILGTLFTCKYLNFTVESLDFVLSKIGIDIQFSGLELIMPIGISFFTLQAVGYLIDVYRKKIEAEKNVIDFAVFLGFFGYILSGPIERAQNILPQLKKKRKFHYTSFCHGIQLMLWGYFVKLVVAERFAIVANTVFDNHTYYAGIEMLLGTIAYSLQLYCDFSGYSYIARGVGQALGLEIINNFEQPYFSLSISEFWRRWHISLSSWLRDYVYIPLGGNRKGIVRKYVNVIIVFFVSGVWHGAAWNYIFWGVLHGIYQVIEGIFGSLKEKFGNKNKQETKEVPFSQKLLSVMWNFTLVNFAWIFFRASNMQTALQMIKRIVLGFLPAATFGAKYLPEYDYVRKFVSGYNLRTIEDYAWLHIGLDISDTVVLLIGFVIIFAVDVLHYQKVNCRNWIDKQQLWFRWLLYIGATIVVLVLGIYGSTYNASSFIYSNF